MSTDVQNAAPGATALAEKPDRRLDLASTRALRATGVTKTFYSEGDIFTAVRDLTFEVARGERMGILGGNGAGKSTLIKLLSGVLTPTGGTIERGISVSWPLALGGGFFDGQLTGYDTIRFVSRLYRLPFPETYAFVSDFSELTDKQLGTAVRFYSSGMSMRLAFALSLTVNFECLLIDEVLAVGDWRFQQKCADAVFIKRPDRAIILAIHSVDVVKTYCNKCLVMKNGRGRVFEDIDFAIRIYSTL